MVSKVLYEAVSVQQRSANPEIPEEKKPEHGIPGSQYRNSGFNIFPNPNDGSIQVQYKVEDGENGLFIIFDISGRKVYEHILSRNSDLLNIPETNLPTGIFYYKITVSDGTIKYGKISVVR